MRIAGASLGVAVLVALGGCSPLAGQGDSSADIPQESASLPPPPDAGLSRFYDQRLDWSDCDGFECATLEVPVDYAAPNGPTFGLFVLRVPARGDRQGTLVVNPGGPGSSGAEYARAASRVVGDPVTDSFDVVGFDPRGVGRSAPVRCADAAQFDALIAADATPDTPAEVDLLERVSAALQCSSPVDGLMSHLTTQDAARDLDVLRAALAEPRLDYLGVSYGTHLGATYSRLFPDRVGRFVLDGPLPAGLDVEGVTRGQALGFEDALARFVAWCQGDGDCPLGDGPDAAAGLDRLQEALAALDARPAPTDDERRPLTESAATYAVLLSLYRVSDRPMLRDALASLLAGDGTPLQRMMDERTGRQPDGSYRDNSLDAFFAISCRDRALVGDVADQAVRLGAVAPLLGTYLAWGNLACAGEAASGSPTDPPRPSGTAPRMLVVATTHDPATPYAWAEQFLEEIGSGVLLTRDGDGHTAYREGSACIDDAVDAFLVDGTLPEAGTVCD